MLVKCKEQIHACLPGIVKGHGGSLGRCQHRAWHIGRLKEVTDFYFHFVDEEAETQKGQVPCSRIHNTSLVKLELQSGPGRGLAPYERLFGVSVLCGSRTLLHA